MFSDEQAKKILDFFVKELKFFTYMIYYEDNRSYLVFLNNRTYATCYYDSRVSHYISLNKNATYKDFISKMFKLASKGFAIKIKTLSFRKPHVLIQPFETLEELLIKIDMKV